MILVRVDIINLATNNQILPHLKGPMDGSGPWAAHQILAEQNRLPCHMAYSFLTQKYE